MPEYVNQYHLSIPGNVLVMFNDAGIAYSNPFRPHSHHTLEISMIASGRGEYRMGEKIYPVKKGDILLFNNVEFHGLWCTEPGGLIVNYALEFEPRFIWSDPVCFFDLNFLSVFLNRNENFSNLLDRSNPIFPEIQRLFSCIAGEFQEQKPEYEMAVKTYLLRILTDIIRNYDICNKIEDIENVKHIGNMSHVLQYINNHYREDLTLGDLAGLLHINKNYFSELFKTSNGIGFKEYIIKKRVSEAAKLLKTTDTNILEIANFCGFSSLSNFYLLFKKIMGIGPGEYRK